MRTTFARLRRPRDTALKGHHDANAREKVARLSRFSCARRYTTRRTSAGTKRNKQADRQYLVHDEEVHVYKTEAD